MTHLPKRHDAVGKTFGLFKVLRISPKHDKLICRCKCGELREVFYGNLMRGRHYSCGAADCRKPLKKNIGNKAWQELGG